MGVSTRSHWLKGLLAMHRLQRGRQRQQRRRFLVRNATLPSYGAGSLCGGSVPPRGLAQLRSWVALSIVASQLPGSAVLNFIVSLASLCKETLETETPTISLQVSLRAARQDEFRHKGSHIDCFDARAGSCYGFLGVGGLRKPPHAGFEEEL